MKRPRIISYCAIFIILTCSWQMKMLSDAKWYWYLFQYLPQDQIMLRYVLSWLGRILLIIAAAGIWNMKNWGRNLALVLLVMHILVLPWKHPPAILENSMTFHPASSKIHEFIQQVSASEKINFYFLASIFLMLWDLMVNAVLIFFLTRENVKKQFS